MIPCEGGGGGGHNWALQRFVRNSLTIHRQRDVIGFVNLTARILRKTVPVIYVIHKVIEHTWLHMYVHIYIVRRMQANLEGNVQCENLL